MSVPSDLGFSGLLPPKNQVKEEGSEESGLFHQVSVLVLIPTRKLPSFCCYIFLIQSHETHLCFENLKFGLQCNWNEFMYLTGAKMRLGKKTAWG